jgi:magnesium transporter
MHRMRKKKKKSHNRGVGAAQGAVEPAGPMPVAIFEYDESHYEEIKTLNLEDCFSLKESPTVSWINIDSISDIEMLEKVGKHFGIHPLILEDIGNPSERSKIEDFDHYIYVLLKMLSYNEKDNEINQEQVSIILGPTYVITFQEQEKKGDLFEPVRDRIRGSKGQIRKLGADYLMYRLVDAIVDNYFTIIEKIGDRIEELEEILMTNPMPATLESIHSLKREMIFLHRSVWPLREVVSRLQRGEMTLIRESTRTYLRDVYDHTIQIIETVETYRDMLSGMLDIYLSSISYRTNEIMKVLTIIATIFIPLTFVAGVYGMNFQNFPELKWHYGYLYFWILNLTAAGGMLHFFHRKKWI